MVILADIRTDSSATIISKISCEIFAGFGENDLHCGWSCQFFKYLNHLMLMLVLMMTQLRYGNVICWEFVVQYFAFHKALLIRLGFVAGGSDDYKFVVYRLDPILSHQLHGYFRRLSRNYSFVYHLGFSLRQGQCVLQPYRLRYQVTYCKP